MVLTAATEPLFPALLKPLLDGSFVNKSNANPYLIPAALIGIFLVRGVLSYLGSYTLAWVSNHVVMDLRNALYRHILGQSASFFAQRTTGQLMSGPHVAARISAVPPAHR